MAQKINSLIEISKELQQLSEHKKTGRFVILFGSSKHFSFYMEQGQITFISYGSDNGMKALRKAVLEFTPGTPVFTPRIQAEHRDESLPSLNDIVALLQDSKNSVNNTATTDRATTTDSLNEKDKAQLLEILSSVIGPVAKVIGESSIASATSIDGAIDQMAAEIPDPAQATEFTEAARRRFRSN